MQQEIRKLQTLNDLVAQTLDVLTQLNQRATIGGLSHSPYAQEFIGTQGYPMSGYVGPQIGLGHSPYIPQVNVPWSQYPAAVGAAFAPWGTGVTGGLGHTPFVNPYPPGFGVDGRYGIDARYYGMGFTQPRFGYPMSGW